MKSGPMICSQGEVRRMLVPPSEMASFRSVIVVTKDRLWIRFMRVFKGLGDEVRPDDLFPRRGPKDVGAAIGDGFVPICNRCNEGSPLDPLHARIQRPWR